MPQNAYDTARGFTLPAGTLVAERYRIQSELGQGGMGKVFQVQDLQLGNRLAVMKVLLEVTSDRSWLRERFELEVDALSRLSHPGVVRVVDRGQLAEGRPYFVMDLVQGPRLREEIPSGGMPLAQVAELMLQLSQALHAVHEHGILHRDLKPENVMLQRLEHGGTQAVLIDFGLATLERPDTADRQTKVVGTVAYMAPELRQGRPPSRTSDLYACGVLLFEMLAGSLPSALSWEGISSAWPNELGKLRHRRPEIPLAVEEALLEALSPHPEERTETVLTWGERVSRALRKLEPTSLPGTPSKVLVLRQPGLEPDQRLGQRLEMALAEAGHSVLPIPLEERPRDWAQALNEALAQAEAVVMILSSPTLESEVLAQILEDVHEALQRGRELRLLAVRVEESAAGTLVMEGRGRDILADLEPCLQSFAWRSPADEGDLEQQLLSALGRPGAPSGSVQRGLDAVDGAVPPDSPFYVQRPEDRELARLLAKRDMIVTIKGARQMGKTSLLYRGLKAVSGSDRPVVMTDFQKLSGAELATAEALYGALGMAIADQLDLEAHKELWWDTRRGANANFERFLRRVVFKAHPQGLIWGMDAVDRLLGTSPGNDFFGMIRAWYNERIFDPSAPWGKLTLIISYAAEVNRIISDANQSPFNVGSHLVLEEFTPQQVEELNGVHGRPLRSPQDLHRFLQLVGGHPHLVRRGLRALVEQGWSVAHLEQEALRDNSPFSDHLRRLLLNLTRDADLCSEIQAVIAGKGCSSPERFYRLRSAGVLVGTSARAARLRCQLYAQYLSQHLT